MNQKEELIVEIATKIHADYCEDELRDFFIRMQSIKENNPEMTPGKILENACFDNDTKRNHIVLDETWLQFHETEARHMFNDYETFKRVVECGGCDIKDFAKRDLTEEEIIDIRIDGDYRDYIVETGEENILRPFSKLSHDSKKENLRAALGAYEVYENLSKAGITIEQMENNPNIKNIIGIAIHTDWLKRNMDHENENLLIPYNQLDAQAKEQDLTVFNALLHVVKNNGDKYKIAPVPNYKMPDYQSMESEVLGQRIEL